MKENCYVLLNAEKKPTVHVKKVYIYLITVH